MKIAALAGLVAVSAAAYATFTFDPTSGTGFIGRGDVITYVGLGCQSQDALRIVEEKTFA